jgi:GH15 family glucan-1,4-alpha-glucosidase
LAEYSVSRGIAYIRCGSLTIAVTSSAPLYQRGDGIEADFSMLEHDTVFLALKFSTEPVDSPPYLLDEAMDAYGRTYQYWQQWCGRLRYDGTNGESVVRSALTLKLLTYSPTGAIVAAPTTSLPKTAPGNRSFDHRYNWIRDASSTATAFCNLQLTREAAEYFRFLQRMGVSRTRLQMLYGVDGEVLQEEELPNLPGWNGAGPVRIGNAVNRQHQADLYGEILIAIHSYLEAVDFAPGRDMAEILIPLIASLAQEAANKRDLPDAGIWETRGPMQHFLHTKALLWAALDRAAKMILRLDPKAAAQSDRYQKAANGLRAEFQVKGWNEEQRAYTQAYGSAVLDAAVLRTVLFGAFRASSPRISRTLSKIESEILAGDLLYRYRGKDVFEGMEGTFTACAFWRVGAHALAGRTLAASALMDRLVKRGNDVALFAAEIDAATSEQRGNFPQTFTHMALINNAVRLQACVKKFDFARQAGAAALAGRGVIF